MTAAEVIQLLQEPEKLMRRCYLNIAGGATRTARLPHLPPPPGNGQAAVATFKVTIDTQAVTGFTTGISGFFKRKKDRPFVNFTKQPGAAKVAPAADEFNAYYIPMVQVADVAAGTSHYTLPTGGGGPDIMITSKLSGCTFGVGSDATGATLVSHVKPETATTDLTQRATDLSNAVGAGFAGGGPASQFRKRAEYTETAAVIGHLSGGTWHFYMQATDYKKHKHVISGVSVA